VFSVAEVFVTAVWRGRSGGQHGCGRSARGRVPPPRQHVLQPRWQAHCGRQRLDVVMGEAPSLLSLVSSEIYASDTGRLRVGNGSTRKAAGGRIVRGPRELVVGSPELVKLESQLWAAGVGPLGRRGRLVSGTCTGATVAHRHGHRRNPIVGRCVDRHLSVSKFSVVTCTRKRHKTA